MATGAPVAVGMAAIGVIGTLVFVSAGALAQLANIAYTQSSSFVLVVVPLFVLMGYIGGAAGLNESLYRACNAWLRHRRGGVALATGCASVAFSPSGAPSKLSYTVPRIRPRVVTATFPWPGRMGRH